jgi:N-acetylglucosamine repressor
VNRLKSNHTSVKRDNRRLILDVIRSESPIARVEISRLTQLTKATVSTLTDELLQEGLIAEVGSDRAVPQVGRKPVFLSFADDVGYVLGIELAVDATRIIAMDLGYGVLGERVLATTYTTLDELMAILQEEITTLMKALPQTERGLVRIGVGVAGFVNYQTGEVIKTPHMPLSGTTLGNALAQAFSVPVFVDNEANTAAWGERLFGEKINTDHLLYVSAGPGIGVGCILEGQLYRGYSGLAGELGHMTVLPDGIQCGCGNQGCWEVYASEQFLRREIGHLYVAENETHPDQTSPPFMLWVDREAIAQNPHILLVLQALGEWLGLGFANIANTFNPRTIVLGNTLATVAEWLIPVIEQVIRKRCLDQVVNPLSIRTSRAGFEAVAKGAAALAVNEFIAQI